MPAKIEYQEEKDNLSACPMAYAMIYIFSSWEKSLQRWFSKGLEQLVYAEGVHDYALCPLAADPTIPKGLVSREDL